MLTYLQRHKYATAIGTIIGIVGIVLATIYWLFPITSESNSIKNDIETPYTSAFSLAEKISSEKTLLAKQEILKNYVGLKTKDKGFFIEVAREQEYGFPGEKSYIVADIAESTTKNKDGLYSGQVIKCKFSEEWKDPLLSADYSTEIEFTGIITDENYYRHALIFTNYLPSITIDNCSYK